MIGLKQIQESLEANKETMSHALDVNYINTKGWTPHRFEIGYQQLMMRRVGIDVGVIDGYIGPQTMVALERWQDRLRDVSEDSKNISTVTSLRWPKQSEVPSFFGAPGVNQITYTPPYQFYLYDTQQKVRSISIHAKVVQSLDRVLSAVLAHYGANRIHDLHLDRYFGALNVRKMRGGNSWSMHSWGIAIDFDASRNQLRWGREKAILAKPVYDEWWKMWEREGWVSLGRERNYDWMHVQAARL